MTATFRLMDLTMPRGLRKLPNISLELDSLSGAETNLGKTKRYAITRKAENELIKAAEAGGVQITMTRHFIIVGGDVVSIGACPTAQRRMRYSSACRVAKRTADAPVGIRGKRRLLAAASSPRLAP
eukprot:7738829-Pyramimonas_sp.AAC.1